VCRLSRQGGIRRARWKKPSQSFIGAHDETLPVTVRVNDPDIFEDGVSRR